MKKGVALLAMLLGAFLSMMAHADLNQTMQAAPDSPQVTQPQNSTTQQGMDNPGNDTSNSSDSTTNSGSSSDDTDDSGDNDGDSES